MTEPEPEPEPEENGGQPLRVSTLELFFDLVFVFAITQLTGILSHEVSVDAENPLQVGLSLGGFAYMAASLAYVGALMLLMARPAAICQLVIGG